jgi:signal transduction histidine kinase
MVANLVTNAVRYGAPPVAVTISASDGWSVVEVTDQGAGVPDEFVPHLFDRFTRPTDGGTSTHRPGTGFGLYIVRRLAEANGCRISYDRDEASGSRFRLEVPADGRPGG